MADNLFNASSLYQMLLNNRMVPQLVDANPFGMRDAGLFSKSTNVVVARDPSKAAFPSIKQEREDTLAHELTHAAQLNLLAPALEQIRNKVSSKEKISKEEQQFMDAMDKLMSENKSWKNLVERLYQPTLDRTDDKYRTRPDELQAWGVGYMTKPSSRMNQEKSNINPHLNPSMASEFSILSDLYSRLPKSIRDIALQSRQQEINVGRKEDTRGLYKDSSSIFSDPFAPTIR